MVSAGSLRINWVYKLSLLWHPGLMYWLDYDMRIAVAVSFIVLVGIMAALAEKGSKGSNLAVFLYLCLSAEKQRLYAFALLLACLLSLSIMT